MSRPVAGLDGRRGGWAAAVLRADGTVEHLALATVAEALALDVAAVGVDMPVGLPVRGRRACDLEAKRVLGAAHARVFLTPPRAVLDLGPDAGHPAASALHRTLVDGKGLSRQSWHLLPKVAEVDDLADDPRLVEVHPELSFAALAGAPLLIKRTVTGRAARLAALATALPCLDAAAVPAGDDAVDAVVVAWSARRWLAGEARTLPGGPPPYDGRGRPMRIVV